jgi:hypothetical protein
LAAAMHATVEVHSPVAAGRGTRFVLRFAATDGPSADERQRLGLGADLD